MIERKGLEQTLIDEEDEDEDDDGRYLNLEGEDDGEYILFFSLLQLSMCGLD